jgi:hypothetical protein
VKWRKTTPTCSGFYFVRMPNKEEDVEYFGEWIGPFVVDVFIDDILNEKFVWMPGGCRTFLQKDVKDEFGDQQSNDWMNWEWAGPIDYPEEP